MEATNATLVITDPNKATMKMYFNGTEVLGVKDLKIDWDINAPKVTVTLDETAMVAEMKANGINVRRSA